jgi:hypothetical protein
MAHFCYLHIKKFPKNIICPKGFLVNRVKKIFLYLKSWEPLKILKLEAVHIQA